MELYRVVLKNLTKQGIKFKYVRFEVLTAVLLSCVPGLVATQFKIAW